MALQLFIHPFLLKPMKRAASVLRHYTDSDATMRQNMRTMHEHYASKQADFLAFNPEFDVAYGAEWLAAIDLADATLPGTVRRGELKEDTAAVLAVMEQAREALQTLYYYVGRTFPGNEGRLDQYGRRAYQAGRNSQDKMRTLLEIALTTATADKLALAAKGYGAPQLAALGTLAEQLTATNTEQEVQKGRNTESSDHYVSVQNRAYDFGREVSAAAKVLYAADAATLGLFRLSSNGSSGPESHELTVEPGQEKTMAFATPLADNTGLHLRLFAPEAGQRVNIGRVKVAGDRPTVLLELTSGDSIREVSAAQLGPAGQVLVVKNAGTVPLRVEVTLQ
jgi:hypothetical protein